MTEAVFTALLTGIFALAGNIVTCILSSRKTQAAIRERQAVTEKKIAALTREVREHNNFARRMPVVEEQIRVINHMLEGRGQPH